MPAFVLPARPGVGAKHAFGGYRDKSLGLSPLGICSHADARRAGSGRRLGGRSAAALMRAPAAAEAGRSFRLEMFFRLLRYGLLMTRTARRQPRRVSAAHSNTGCTLTILN